MDTNENFRQFLVNWMADNWRENQSAFAAHIGITKQHLSNLICGHKSASEKARIRICNRLGVDYRTLIITDDKSAGNSGTADIDQKKQKANLELAAMQADLLEIYRYGDTEKINAIKINLTSLKVLIQMEKRADKKAALSLKAEEVSLIKPAA